MTGHRRPARGSAGVRARHAPGASSSRPRSSSAPRGIRRRRRTGRTRAGGHRARFEPVRSERDRELRPLVVVRAGSIGEPTLARPPSSSRRPAALTESLGTIRCRRFSQSAAITCTCSACWSSCWATCWTRKVSGSPRTPGTRPARKPAQTRSSTSSRRARQLVRRRKPRARGLRGRRRIEQGLEGKALAGEQPARLDGGDVPEMPADRAVRRAGLLRPETFRRDVRERLLEEAARRFQLREEGIVEGRARFRTGAPPGEDRALVARLRDDPRDSLQRSPSSGSEARHTPSRNGAQYSVAGLNRAPIAPRRVVRRRRGAASPPRCARACRRSLRGAAPPSAPPPEAARRRRSPARRGARNRCYPRSLRRPPVRGPRAARAAPRGGTR